MRNFKRTLKVSLIFLLLIALLSAAIMFPYFSRETYYYQDGHVRDSMAGKLDLLICGASQSQRAISPAILDEALGCNSYNIASPLLTFRGRYYIIEQELARNDIDTVIIELCYDTLARDRDEVDPEGEFYMLGRITDPIERTKYFFSAARLDEYAEFYYDCLQRGIYAWQHWEEGEIGSNLSYQNKGYDPLDANPIEMIDEEQYYKEAISTEFAEENLEFLDKIFALCREKGVEVIVISTPLSDSAILSYDALDTIHKKYQAICDKWECEYYDFSLYKEKSTLFSDQDSFFDRNHLSTRGAEAFSPLLAEVVAAWREGKSSQNAFYQSYGEAQKAIEKRYA